MTYACPAWEFAPDIRLLEIAAPAEERCPRHWQFPKAHVGARYARGFPFPCDFDYMPEDEQKPRR
jgi:hypothetical protein